MTFTVSLSQQWTEPVTVNYTVSDVTAENGIDYRGPASAFGTVTIPTGQTSATFTVSTVEDAIAEPSETFMVTLSAPSGGLPANVLLPGTGSVAHGTIADDDMGPGAPTGLTATARGASVELTWTAPSNRGTLNGATATITGYAYRISTSPDLLVIAAAPLTATDSTNTTHTVQVGAAGTYYFVVQALNGVTDSNGNPTGACLDHRLGDGDHRRHHHRHRPRRRSPSGSSTARG